MLDQIDDTLAAIHRISKGNFSAQSFIQESFLTTVAGQVKVIIAPHDAHALRGSNDVPCDAYCEKLNPAFLDFYSVDEYKELYKTRLDVFFNHYPSKNFEGRSWSELSEVILGVDVQNEPWAGIHPIVAGESWLCIMSTHLKDKIGLGKSGIAVITGGISGPQSATGTQNFPDSAFDCPAVDEDLSATAGTPWANIFLPGNTLTARALGQKLLLVEEWSFKNTGLGLTYKKQAIFDQGNALNYRGIPWLYSYLTIRDEGSTAKISITREDNFAIGALKNVLLRAYNSRSSFNWSKFLPAPKSPLTSLTHVAMNPYIPEASDCTFGCEGFLCDAPDGCSPDLLCKNSICQNPTESQPGKIGDTCNSKKPCISHLFCENGACEECLTRPSIVPEDHRKSVVYNNPSSLVGSCELDTANPFRSRPYCALPPSSPSFPNHKTNPCANSSHCSANEFCSWGLCTACGPEDACLGAKCKSNNKCKTGFCNTHGRCDYPVKSKLVGNNGRATWRSRKGAGWNAGPKNQEKGPNKVRDEAMRINIPKEKVVATGQAQAMAAKTA
ncbi:hypothetical protein P280DRAFT_462399 [Massarina eburnea CBS 473.64]|uniref:Uncharacterized protein n=1 Tax=Massarina eburnea CBS 473.64 TaxID=1395130 RepID=A0A6A6RIV9_9PLEO|nr:hypothetical protein P280DRAFT_462399 [Massarina eburnea CBS 473.64]